MNKQMQEMKDVATGIVNGLLASNTKTDVVFKRTIALHAGEGKDVLVFGNVHPEYNDGYCIAVLNPRLALQELLQPAVAYSPAILNELVAGHCEAMVQVQIVGKRASLESSYHARHQ
ncbi:MAG: hypothetical protein Q8S26_12080 [Azonexus sp.]|nr:hypothetical protein [Azonexus sp.]